MSDRLPPEPIVGAAPLEDVRLDRTIDQIANCVDPLAVPDVELGLSKWRRQLVLHDLDPGAIAEHGLTLLHRPYAADIEAHGRIVFQRMTAGGRFRRTEHHPDLHAQLIDEDDRRTRSMCSPCQLSERLAHQPCLEADMGRAQVAVELCLGHERRDRVDHDQVDRSALDENLRDVERLLAVVRLAHQQLLGVHAELLRIVHVEGVLGVDERGNAPGRLTLRDGVESERRLSARFGPIDLDHASLGVSTTAKGFVERRTPTRDTGNPLRLAVTETHHRALAKLLLDALQQSIDGLEWLFHVQTLLVVVCEFHRPQRPQTGSRSRTRY